MQRVTRRRSRLLAGWMSGLVTAVAIAFVLSCAGDLTLSSHPRAAGQATEGTGRVRVLATSCEPPRGLGPNGVSVAVLRWDSRASGFKTVGTGRSFLGGGDFHFSVAPGSYEVVTSAGLRASLPVTSGSITTVALHRTCVRR